MKPAKPIKVPEYTISSPYTFKVLELSTVHITKHDSELLKQDDLPFTCYDLEYGWMLFCDTRMADRAYDITRYGFSAAFLRLIHLAWDNECTWIRLDCDGFVYDDLPKFKW